MGRRNKMKNRIEALEIKLKTVEDEVQKIPTMENNITTLLQQMPHLLISKEEEQQRPSQAKRRGEEQRRVPECVAHRIQELPLFNGIDSPARWILRMERYFKFNHIDDFARMMEIIPLSLSGQAFAWFQLVQRLEKPPGSWDEFRHDLSTRFEDGDTMYDRFISLQQNGSVRNYCSQFELFGVLRLDIPDCILEAKFMHGLKAEIRTEVRKLQPKGIEEIMRKARLVEDNNNVALNSAVVNTSYKTMKLKGTIEERAVVFEIVSGAAYSFISETFATELELPLDYTGDYSIVLGNGKTIKGDRIFRNVLIQVQNLIMVEDFLPLEMKGDSHEVILGMTWLVTLGYTEVIWKDLTMKLKVGKETVTLRGDPSL